MSNEQTRIGDFPTPEEIAASFVPVSDDEIEKPQPRIGPELLHRIEADPKGQPLVAIDELAEGHLYAMIYVGSAELPGLMVANLNDEWCKWRDGKRVGPLTFSAKHWRLMQVPADADFAPLVAVAKPRAAVPHLSDFGAIVVPRDAGVACQQIAELRGYLVNRVLDVVGELPEHLLRDDPGRLLVQLVEEHLAEIVRRHEEAAAAAAELAAAPPPAAARPSMWWAVVAAVAAPASVILCGHLIGWW